MTTVLAPTRDAADLPLVVTTLMRGVLDRDEQPEVWRRMLPLQDEVRRYVATLGLVPVVDETDGYAVLRQRTPADAPAGTADEAADPAPAAPRLVGRRSLSFPVSLLLAVLRRRLAETDATDPGTRVVLSRTELTDLLQPLLPAGESRSGQIDGHVARVVELGFLRRLPAADGGYEIRRVLKTFVDAQWLTDLDRRLAEYTQRSIPGTDPAQREDAS